MNAPSSKKPKIFVSYSHKDADLKKEFDTNLRVMERQGIIEKWTDGEIQPGDRWAESITDAMNSSHIIIFMVSNNFLASDFIRDNEAPLAIQRMTEGKAVVVPILLRNTPGWKSEKWYSLQALPSDVKPVEHKHWGSTTDAFADVEERLREMIKLLPAKLREQRERNDELRNNVTTIVEPVLLESELTEKNSDSRPNDSTFDQMFEPTNSRNVPKNDPRKWNAGALAGIVAVLLVAGAVLYKMNFHREVEGINSSPILLNPYEYEKENTFNNSLGMKFVNLPDTEVLCSIWELRVDDFDVFASETNFQSKNEMYTYEMDPVGKQIKWGIYEGRNWKNPGFYQNGKHPVVGISLANAKRFCDWLTTKERIANLIPENFEYRIIRDAEWSIAAGDSIYPWDPYKTARNRRGNYEGMLLSMDAAGKYDDGNEFTAPVASYDANHLGIYDLGGNLCEVLDTAYDRSLNSSYLLKKYPDIDTEGSSGLVCTRGGDWGISVIPGNEIDFSLSELRWTSSANFGGSTSGFRVVLSPVNYDVSPNQNIGIFGYSNTAGKESFVLSNKIGEKIDFFYQLPMPDNLKDFDATFQYRVLKISRDTGFSLAFKFRQGAYAPDGHRAYVSHMKLPTWGSGYFNGKGDYVAVPWKNIEQGAITTDGSPNRIRLVVRGNVFKIYSNDCFLGETEFDGAPLAGSLSVVGQLCSYGAVWGMPNDGKDPEEQFVEIEIDHIEVKK